MDQSYTKCIVWSVGSKERRRKLLKYEGRTSGFLGHLVSHLDANFIKWQECRKIYKGICNAIVMSILTMCLFYIPKNTTNPIYFNEIFINTYFGAM